MYKVAPGKYTVEREKALCNKKGPNHIIFKTDAMPTILELKSEMISGDDRERTFIKGMGADFDKLKAIRTLKNPEIREAELMVVGFATIENLETAIKDYYNTGVGLREGDGKVVLHKIYSKGKENSFLAIWAWGRLWKRSWEPTASEAEATGKGSTSKTKAK